MIVDNILLTTINAITFGLLAVVFWLLPGNALLPEKPTKPILERTFLAIMLGFAVYTAVIFVTRLLGLPFWLGGLPFLILAVRGAKKWVFKRKKIVLLLTNQQKIFILLALVGAIIQGLVLMRSGVRVPNGMQFTQLSFHDSIWHIYLIDELKDHFPPRHAGFAPLTLKNYHFLLDLAIASFTKYLPLSTFELYFRMIPLFVSLSLSLGVFVVTRRLSGSELAANIAVFLTLFSGNASWFLKFFRGEEFQYSANTFMLDPILDLLQNPHAVIVFPLMLAGILALQVLEKKPVLPWMGIAAILFGVMIGFKAWGGTIMMLSLPLAALWMSVTKRRHNLWVVWLGALIISILIFYPFYDAQTAARPIFVPGWLLKRMVEDPDRYNMPNYYFLEQYYRYSNNSLALIVLNLKQLLIYILGNLWVKLIGIAFLVRLLRKITPQALFMISVVLFSFSLPVLFNQGRMSYDIIQFAPYGVVLMSIFSAISLYTLYEKVPKKFGLVVILTTLMLSLPSNSRSIIDRATGEGFVIPSAELQAYEYLKEETDVRSVVLIYHSKVNIDTAKVAALSQRPTYFSARTFSRISGEDYEEREKQTRLFFEKFNSRERKEFLQDNKIDYLLLTSQENKKINADELNIRRVFSNEQTVIYKVI